MGYIEKHVEFTDDLNNNNNEDNKEYNQQQKLHRRDTPHHLKNKRIINKNNDSITLDVRFSRIFISYFYFLICFLANYVT